MFSDNVQCKSTNAGQFVVSFIRREMLHLWLVIGFLQCGGSYAKESSNLDQNQWIDIMNELKALRKEVEENRKRINYQKSELKAVKLELEGTKRYCHSGPVPMKEKSKSEEVEVFSRVKNSIIRSREQSKISKSSFTYQLDENKSTDFVLFVQKFSICYVTERLYEGFPILKVYLI